MRAALRLARRGHTSPNPMVGAVAVREGTIVGHGYHRRAGGPHAEVIALAQAGEKARGSALYVTLEPCCHHGLTPPCVDTVIASGVRRVVSAMVDPNPRVSGRGLAALRQARIDVTVGVLENEARRLNESYIKHITTGLPYVTLKMAMSLDGKIAAASGDSRWISCEKSRRTVHAMRARADAVVIGAGAAMADDPELTARLVKTRRQPARVIVDERAQLTAASRMLNAPGGQVIVATTRFAQAAALRKLEEAGARILLLEQKDGLVDLGSLFRGLAGMGMINLLLEGGGEIAAAALDARLVDKVIVFIAPKILGGRSAKTPVEGAGVDRVAQALELSDVKTRRSGSDIVVIARPNYAPTEKG